MRGRRKSLDTFEGQIDNFLSKIEITDSCWNWKGFSRGQYGGYWYDGRNWVAHRLAYKLFLGNFDNTLDVCHTCDNTRCVRPSHLFAGTVSDNMQDMYRKGRNKQPKGIQFSSAKLDNKKVYQIKKAYNGGAKVNELSRNFGVHRMTIYRVLNNKAWKHVTEGEMNGQYF